jgi:hypothetical protein
MEGTPLRSVPARVPGPVDAAEALAHVEAKLPELPTQAQRALALVEVAGRPRTVAANELGVAEADLSRLLAAGRKALRRTLAPLPAGGWCERAERLLSDRLDDALLARGAARLEAHLGGCERCVTHERKLLQARDQLIDSFVAAHFAPAPALAPAAELRLVEAGEHAERSIAWRVAFVIVLLLAVMATVIALLATGSLAVSPK